MQSSRLLRPQAREDALEIWQYIAADNETAANALLHRFDRAIRTLADNPLAGRERPELGRDIRSFPVGNYILFYIPTTNAIEVVRILHAARDITTEELE
ncbi:type II toxin-antitoxin system RelE/ParE family toxin [Bradyrhizobium sp. HKCCYLS2038]|uniref:type II toxin-antitoxin system RelE/ParE family toxin n=1 Tax=unclassified Bradyrhizobium TaxID=2631580 RepID=UPI003EBFA1BE